MNMVVVLDDGKRFVGFGSKDMSYGIYDIIAQKSIVTQIGPQELEFRNRYAVNPDLILPQGLKIV